MRTDPLVRFWQKVDKNGPIPANRPELGPCWIWLAGAPRGYGSFSLPGGQHGTNFRAHRYAYELEKGKIPRGKILDHLCRTTRCVNPSHLDVTTQEIHVFRGFGLTVKNRDKTHCVRGHLFSL